MMRTIANYSVSMELLRKYEHKARKRFGQNFIIDPSVVERIARYGKDAEIVLEIGPGLGALTQEIAKRYPKVIAYEIDGHVIDILRESLADMQHIEIRHQDFLAADLSEFKAPIAVAANLPYYITTPILFKLLEVPVVSMVLMVQKEIGERLAAVPKTKAYSALSIQMQYHFRIKTVMKVSKESFHPRPNVDSIVIECLPKEDKAYLENPAAFFAFVRSCFQFRRKTLLNNLRTLELDKDLSVCLEMINLPQDIRADHLDFAQFKALYEVLYA